MYPTTSLYLRSIRSWSAVTCSASYTNPFTQFSTDLPIVDGLVTVDGTAQFRRQLSITIPPTQNLVDTVGAPGGLITAIQQTRYIDRTTEIVPLGTFVVDSDTIDYSATGDLVLTCPDQWLMVQRNRFRAAAGQRSSVPGNTTWAEIKRLVEGAWPNSAYPFPGWAQVDHSATTKVGPLVWADGDRSGAIANMAAASSVEVFFNADGLAVLRPVPVLTSKSSSVWTVDAADKGVMISGSSARDRSRTRNAVIVETTAPGLYLPPVTVANSNPADPLSTVGPLGFVPWYLSSPTFYSTAQMTAAGKTALSKQLGVAQQMTLEAVPNAALDAGDVIGVLLPQIDRTTPRVLQTHIIDSLTIPLLPGGTQTIQTRSTRPTSDDTGGS